MRMGMKPLPEFKGFEGRGRDETKSKTRPNGGTLKSHWVK